MPIDIKLTKKDEEGIRKRLSEEGALPPDEKQLLKALLEMAEKHPLHEGGVISWAFRWNPPPPPPPSSSART